MSEEIHGRQQQLSCLQRFPVASGFFSVALPAQRLWVQHHWVVPFSHGAFGVSRPKWTPVAPVGYESSTSEPLAHQVLTWTDLRWIYIYDLIDFVIRPSRADLSEHLATISQSRVLLFQCGQQSVILMNFDADPIIMIESLCQLGFLLPTQKNEIIEKYDTTYSINL